MSHGQDTDAGVIVVGGGPTGLWLACELRLAGVPTLVLERNTQRGPNAKAMTVHARTIEVLAMRGLADRFLSDGRRLPDWHFGLLESRLDLTTLDSPFPFLLAHSQIQTEEKLEQRALELGAKVLRGHAVVGLQQDDDAVTVEVAGPAGEKALSAPFLVGCDGAGSAVRRLAGIEFPGTPASIYGYLGDVALTAPPQGGFNRHGPEGSIVVVPLPTGRFRIFGYDPAYQVPENLTFEQLRGCAIRQAGTDFGMHDPTWLSRFDSATRVAANYRENRVLLAGDSAHMHFPAGGVGLNIGVQDAMNLGWKLAAEVQGRAAPGLLDSYHRERHPVGEEVARHTMAQTALMTQISPEGLELRALMNRLIAGQPELSRTLAEKLSAIDVHYPVDGGAHSLVGARVPGPADFFGILEHGRPVLLNLSSAALAGASKLAAAIGIETCPSPLADSGRPAWAGVGAVIVRPDGHVWWAAGDSPDLEAELIEGLASLGTTFRS